MTSQTPKSPPFDRLLLTLSALVPAGFVLVHATNVSDASHERDAIRILGLTPHVFGRALDVLVGVPFQFLPIGTRSFRLALAGVLMTAIVGALVYRVTHRMLAACAPADAPPAFAAAWGSMVPLLTLIWQIESLQPGGGNIGVLLAWGPLAVLALGRSQEKHLPAVVSTLTLAMAYDLGSGVAALSSVLAFIGLSDVPYRRHLGCIKKRPLVFIVAILFALAPTLSIALLSRAAAAPSAPFPGLDRWFPSVEGTAPSSFLTLVQSQMGWATPFLGLLGFAFSLMSAKGRPFGAALGAYVIAGVLASRFGVEARRGEGVALSALVAIGALGGLALHVILIRVAKVSIPFARGSAILMGVLALAIPAQLAEDGGLHLGRTHHGASLEWDQVAWGSAPIGSLMLVHRSELLEHMLASKLRGTFRGDIAVVPSHDLGGRLATSELAREPKLISFWRDMATGQNPEEWSLSSLAMTRPLVLVATPPWGRSLARHLVPLGLVTRFETEPRGMSDRRHALEKWAPSVTKLAGTVSPDFCAPLRALAVILLQARIEAFSASGDRDLMVEAQQELDLFATAH